MLKKPKMILFDYGQTLINEIFFDGIKGTKEVLKYAIENKYGKTAEEVQAVANEINDDLGRIDPKKLHEFQIEVNNIAFQNYLYESLGITLSISGKQIEKIFWDTAAPGEPTVGIVDFLEFLHRNGIRAGVISNISFCGESLRERINHILPNNNFEFIIASSDYVFRKPNKRIFELALQKADLKAEDVWYVGDQLQCDIVGAKNCGMQPVWYKGAVIFEQKAIKEEYITISCWSELEEIAIALLDNNV